MTQVIDFKSKIKELSISNLKVLLEGILQEVESFNEICVLLKDKNGDYSLVYSNNLSMADKAFFSTMLQHDIFNELDLSEEVTFEPNQ